MITKKQLIIKKYLLMVEQLRKILNVDIFPEFNDVVDILFYFQYNFLMVPHPAEKIEDILILNHIDGSLFPSLDDYDITDIIFYLNLYFAKGREEEYIDTIEKLMKQKQIDINDDDYTTVVNLIIDFINFLNNL